VRDLPLFIGTTEELPDTTFGAGLPGIREWTGRWYDDVPYIVPFDPAALTDRGALRAKHGYAAAEPLLVATVGGTAAGRDLLELVAEGFPTSASRSPRRGCSWSAARG